MSLKSQQQTKTTEARTDDGTWDLTKELKVICTLWILGALLAGVGFVAFSNVFTGLA